MNEASRITELEARVAALTATRRRTGWRSRWAAIGAAIAVAVGGGTVLHQALAAPGDVVPTSFVAVAPTRILDTRPAPENVGGFTGPLTSGATHTFQVAGMAGVPTNATAVVMNVTVDATTASSFLTVFPAGATRPTASNLNWTAGTTIPNLVTVKLGTGGQVSVYNLTGNAHVIADVAGYYVPGNDKFISLDVFGGAAGTATFNDGFGANAGLAFSDAVSQDTSFHFVVPPDYTPGTALVASMTWHTTAVSCNVTWLANYTSVSRSGQLHLSSSSASAGMTDPTPGAAGSTANLVQTATVTLTSPAPATSLQPGDSYTFGIYRSGAAPSDTCASTAIVDSMVIRYE